MELFQNGKRPESLCETCRHGVVVRGFTENDEAVYCEYLWPNRLIPFVVRECTKYGDRNERDLDDLKEIALLVRPRSGQAPGFVRSPGFVEPKPAGSGETLDE